MATAHRQLYNTPGVLNKLHLSHYQRKLLNACCLLLEHAEVVLWSVSLCGLGFTPHLTDPAANCSQERWPSFPSPAHHQFPTLSLCWDHRAACRHNSLLSARSGASPGDCPVVGVMRDTGWEHTVLQQRANRSSKD